MVINDKTALVLEGGGLRGVFTCGVLDCFMDHGIRFPLTIGVTVRYALEQGYDNPVVILTRNKGYRKKENKMRVAMKYISDICH